jgi:formate hydrogenlyase transcriptional activator
VLASKSQFIMGAPKPSQTALEGVRNSHVDFRTILDSMPTLTWSGLPDGFADFVNQRWSEYTGLSFEELRESGWKSAIHPDDLATLAVKWDTVDCAASACDCEVRLRRSDGTFRWFSLRREPLYDEAGSVIRWFGTGIDIDDAKQRDALHAAEKLTLEMIADGASLADVLNHLCNSIDFQVAPSVTTILLLDEDGKRLWQGGGTRAPQEWMAAVIPVPVAFDAGLCGTAAFLKERVIVQDVATEPNWREEYRGLAIRNGIRAAWSEPILTKGNEVLGTFALYSHEARVPSEEDLALIKEAGQIALIAIERQRAQARLRQDEEELRRIVDLIPHTIVVLNPDGRVMYANRTTLEYTGLSLDEIRSDGSRERIFHPEDVQRLREERLAGLSGSTPFENEQRALGKDGTYRWFLIRYNPLLDGSGKVVRWYATGTEIDDRVRLEERTRNENLALREQIDRESMFEDIVGSSEALRKMLRQVARVAPSDSTVLILGETGTGKELIARAIHKRSKRADRAFIGVNCAAIPTSLFASELFGHEKGAFTGATQRRLGRFEAASGGTIFLDEIGDLPPEIQIALLRVLQEREIERVGSNKPISIDVRVLAATHHDLEALVAEGRFREDLLYRLSVVPLQMPSLRERREDIPLLVEYFIGRFGKKAGKKFRTIDKKTAKLFESYQWPGNVRELQNVIERAVILSEDATFSVDEACLKQNPTQFSDPPTALNRVLLRREKEMIESALAESEGRVSGQGGAAAKLRIPTRTLDSKIKRLGINKLRFKKPQAN